MASSTTNDYQVSGKSKDALFTLKIHRGDGMALLAMNWKKGRPPLDFVGFAIEYMEPKGQRFFALKNRLGFSEPDKKPSGDKLSSLRSPIQKFRWVHFPRNAELPGLFRYRVTPVFMNAKDELSNGVAQEAEIQLHRETYPGKLNVCFTRGFVSSQAFVDRYESQGKINTLLPAKSAEGLEFKPTHPDTEDALDWMGFEARHAILELLDQAIADPKAKVYVTAYDLNEPEVVERLEKLGPRLKIIIDDSAEHGETDSAETQAAQRLAVSAGVSNVKRQHMGQLQHNKTIAVDGPKVKAAVCGSTNFTWRGFYVQNNNAVILRGKTVAKVFADAFNDYWNNETAGAFGKTPSALWTELGLTKIDAKVAFSPHSADNALLQSIGDDIAGNTRSSLFFSLAFLYQTSGPILDAINKVTNTPGIFVYGISDKEVGGIEILKPSGNVAPVNPQSLTKEAPEPFKSEPTGGGGTRMHHKFVVIDFDQPSARVYFGSYNFSPTADRSNGENLLLIRDRRVATAYMIEALRIFDHYHFRIKAAEMKAENKALVLARPPRAQGELPWFDDDYTDPRRIRDRELFA